jgi:gamma-glutamyltranspeptidase
MIAPHDLAKQMGHNSPEAIQTIVEAERSIADRNFFFPDPDFAEMPITELMDDNNYLEE